MRYEITPADLKGALQREGVQIRSGDVVLIHTGWSSLWMKDNAKYGDSEPGIGLAAGQMLVDAEVVVVGADTWGVEVMPNPDSSLSAPVHQLFLARNGIYLHENLITADLGARQRLRVRVRVRAAAVERSNGVPGKPDRDSLDLRVEAGFRPSLIQLHGESETRRYT